MPPIRNGLQVENRILLALPKPEFEKVSSDFEAVPLEPNQALFEVGQPVRHAYFLNSGLASFIAVSTDGSGIEVAAIGNEGMIPLQISTRPQEMIYRCIVQLPGTALKISIVSLRKSLRAALSEPSVRLLQMMHNRSSQLILCNRFHTIEQRLCRWLLLTADNAKTNSFPVTHEFLSYVLGANRSTITIAMGILKKAKLIAYRSRMVTILDRKRTEEMACECYRVYRTQTAHYV